MSKLTITFTAEVENDYEAEKLKRRFHMLTDPDWIASWWSISDVQDCVDFEMTDEECREVLRRVDKYHDANIGINWEVLQDYADQVVEERETVLE